MPEPANPDNSSGATPTSERWLEDDIALGWYLRALTRAWKWLAVGAAVGALAAGAFAFSRTVLYQATTTLLIASPVRIPGAQANPQTFRAIVENASLASEVVSELRLGEPPNSLTPQTFLERALTVVTTTGSNVVRVSVRLRDPIVAADASRRLALKGVALARQLSEEEGAAIQEQLKGHLTAAAARLADTERALLTYQQSAQVEVLKKDTDAMLDQRGDLLKLLISIESEKARLAAAEREIAGQDRMLTVGRSVSAEEALRRAGVRDEVEASPPAEATDRPSLAVDSDLLNLTNRFINPVYQTLEFQIATSRSRLAALEQQRRQLVDVRKLGGDGFSRLSELYDRTIELARLQTEFDLAKRIHSDLTVRFEESRTQTLGNSPQLQLVDAALPPDRPLSRGILRLVALGFAAGLVAAAVLALLVESR